MIVYPFCCIQCWLPVARTFRSLLAGFPRPHLRGILCRARRGGWCASMRRELDRAVGPGRLGFHILDGEVQNSWLGGKGM